MMIYPGVEAPKDLFIITRTCAISHFVISSPDGALNNLYELETLRIYTHIETVYYRLNRFLLLKCQVKHTIFKILRISLFSSIH